MARLGRYEIDAIVSTILDQIKEKSKDSTEQIEYRRLCQLERDLEKEGADRLRLFKIELAKEISLRSEGLDVKGNEDSNYYGICVASPTKPKTTVDEKTIERDIIIANISGNVEETIEKIVNKYTK